MDICYLSLAQPETMHLDKFQMSGALVSLPLQIICNHFFVHLGGEAVWLSKWQVS
jgi:hypothetical protein